MIDDDDVADFADSIFVEELDEMPAEFLDAFTQVTELAPDIDFWSTDNRISKHELKR